MQTFVKRPAVTLNPGNGLFRNDHFQVAYATNNIERACRVLGERYGIKEYRSLEGQLPAGGHVHIELAWAGGTMYELVQGSGPGTEFYRSVLPMNGFAIRHHHLGYFIHDQAAWDALQNEIERGGLKVVFENKVEGFINACYIEAPELGHYLEYLFPEPAGIAFFDSVPCS